jgi:hypothetical protein
MKQRIAVAIFILALAVPCWATVSSTTSPSVTYDGNGSTTTFPVTFTFIAATDLEVVHTDADGAETTWVKDGAGDTGYTVVATDVEANTAPASGTTLTITRATPLTQGLDLRQGRSYSPQLLEDALDRLTLIVQELELQLVVNDYFTGGLLDLDYGGTGADTSSYDGILAVASNALYELDTASELESAANLPILLSTFIVASDCEAALDGVNYVWCRDSDDNTFWYFFGGQAITIGSGSVVLHENSYPHDDYDAHLISTSNPHTTTLSQLMDGIALGSITPLSGTVDWTGVTEVRGNDVFDLTPSSDDSWSGDTAQVTAGETIAQWDQVYLKYDTDGPRAFMYNAATGATDNDTYRPFGVALEAGTAGNAMYVGFGCGVARNDGWTFTDAQDEGKPVFAGETDGAITLTRPSDSGDHIIQVGTLIDEDEVLFCYGSIQDVEVP